MQGLFKFLTSLFTPRNYTEMLRKLAFFLFWEIWIATFFLREIEVVDNVFRAAEQFGPLKDLMSLLPVAAKLNLLGFVIALLFAIFSYAFKLHDRISDLFGIRNNFDYNHILLPLAALVGIRLTAKKRDALISRRDSILRIVFYTYVSSRKKKTLVDKHDIERALEGWSWYWVLIEAMPIALLGALIAAMSGSCLYASAFLAVFLIAFACSWLYYSRLPRLARPEIESIANDTKARAAVIKAFRAL